MLTKPRFLDLLGGLALTLLLLAGIEGALALTGFQPPAPSTNWSRGFDPDASYFVPDAEVEGAWRTNFLPKIQGTRFIPPRDDRELVLLFGGSNTADFPAGLLQQELNQLAGGPAYRVVNLGRSGYGSARVRIIFEQALELLDPDIVVIYTGHNEFVEKGFELDLAETEDSNSVFADAARKTRMFEAFRSRLVTQRPEVQKDPDNWKWEYEKFLHLTFPETRRYFSAYEDNLRAMTESAQARGAKVVLSTIIYNRLSAPFSSTFPEELSDSNRQRFDALRAEALSQLPAYLAPLLPAREQDRVHRKDWGGGDNPKNRAPVQLDSWRSTTDWLATEDRMLQRESIWGPAVREMDRCLIRFNARETGDGDLPLALARLEEALELCPDHPRALFELGLVEWLLGRDSKLVVEHLEAAARWDRAPRKGSETTNEIVRNLANEIEGTHLFDADAEFKSCHPDDLVGWEWMCDHCHMHFGARVQLMGVLARDLHATWPDTPTDR